MLATTGVERPDGDTATWLWAVLADHAERQSGCTCGGWSPSPSATAPGGREAGHEVADEGHTSA